ncbi:tetratricopeptide repeat protein [Archangium gephyra]|uniref:tetratricopeptide repeat protein n=1 Tax=Archangium gephyra TaxID=48 RepID=UPI0035D4E26A
MSPRRLLLPGLLLLASACATTPRPDAKAAAAAPSAAATPDAAPAAPAPKQPAPQDTAAKKADAPPPADALSVAQRGELTAAESSYQTQTERRPKDGAAWTNLGITQERLGKHDEAERSYRQALELAPEQQAAWDNLARLQCRTGKAAQAESWLREQLQAKPDALAPRTALVQALLCQKKLDAAATEAKRILKSEERNVRAMQLLAQVYYRERKYELARMVLENARTVAPDEAATHNALGLVLLALGTKPAALESFKKASELKPDFAEARNNLGALLNEAQDHAAAARELEAAVQAAPDFVSARLNLGNAYRGQGDFTRALAEYQQVLRLAPALPDTYFNLAILHLDAEPKELDTLARLQACLSYFEQYRARGGRDERVDDYVKDARKGIEKEERRREREKREQLRKAQQAEAPASGESPTSDRVAEEKK